jgi:hypothetical protein
VTRAAEEDQMLSKLLSMLVASKGGAVAAAAIVAGATTVSVATTTPEIQDAVNAVSGIVAPGLSQSARAKDCDGEKGQPVVVAQRNAADKLIRDAYQDEHKRLTDLRGGKDVDHEKANAILQKADRDLRGVVTQALNDVAAQTLGREGQIKVELSEPSPTASTGASASPSAKPSCTPKPSASPSAPASASPAPNASPSGSPSAEQRGRVAVANRTTLTPPLEAIVTKATADMKQVVDKAVADVAALPVAEHGKSGEQGKPEDKGKTDEQRGKSDENKDGHGKPSSPPGKPTSTPRP